MHFAFLRQNKLYFIWKRIKGEGKMDLMRGVRHRIC